MRITNGFHWIGLVHTLVIATNPTFIHGQAVAVVDLQVGVGGEFHRGVGPVDSAWKPVENRPFWLHHNFHRALNANGGVKRVPASINFVCARCQ